MSISKANALCLEREVDWFSTVLETSLSLYFKQETEHQDIYAIPFPDLKLHGESEYARLVRACGLGVDERIVLMLALVPHIRPQALDAFFMRNTNLDRGFTEVGGWRGKSHSGFLPTCETAAFIVAGRDLQKRFEMIRLFEQDHLFAKKGILRVEHQAGGEPFFSGALLISTEYLNRLTSGITQKPDYSANFPAKLITTKLG